MPTAANARCSRLVEAHVIATHAFQVLLARKPGRTTECEEFTRGAPPSPQLEAVVAHQVELLKSDAATVAAWIAGTPSRFDPQLNLEPIHGAKIPIPERAPVAVFTAWLSGRAPAAPAEHVRAVANLHQMVMEIDRDGTVLQDLMHAYIALGVSVYLGQLGIPGGDEAALLRMGDELAPRTCAGPFATDAASWQISSLKIWNWGGRHTHVRDARVIAGEMLAEPATQALLPAIRAMPAQKIAVIGHSFTMDLNWSSPSAFVPIATAILARENPRVEIRQFQEGGMSATRAEANFLKDALAYRPDLVLVVCLISTDEDLAAFTRMAKAFTAAGARFAVFDDLLVPFEADGVAVARRARATRDAGGTVIEVGRILTGSPVRSAFLSLDGIHM
nr:hypothetical protein [Planctomycetota bacterium]